MKFLLTVCLILLNMIPSATIFANSSTTKTEPIEIAFVGDVMMDGSIKDAIKKHGADYPFQHIKAEIEKSDYAVLNLETAVTTRTDKFKKDYNFKADPTSLKGITNAGFDMVSLGNNHAMDYKEEGLEDTIKHLKEYELEYIGAGLNEKEAYSSKTIEIKNKKIKFLGFSRVLPDISWYAGKNKPGIASGYQEDRVIRIIKEERKDCDYLFVYIHWGKESKEKPEDYQIKYAKKMIDAGADGIIGSHPHVLQGFEYYKDKPIAYSLGNFLFPSYVSGKKAETGILKLKIDETGIGMSFKPYLIKNNQITTLSKKEEDRILKELQITK